ncbi:hypothetical protein [Natronococcus sp. JC468]|uniref:hypothetical protein n=1 Tax=Natronococcus sp. JC468 TaxID=1961921 RepID=UPI001ADF6E23|nr:hypothetical protein [Natronococcus sp. JC468]
MEYDTVHERFLELEAELDLFDRRIDGVPFWERARFEIHKEVVRKTTAFGRARSEPDVRRGRLRQLSGLARNLVVRNPYLSPSSEIAVFGHARRKRLADGYWWDIYTDPILEALELDAVSLEKPRNYAHHTPAKTDDLRYLDLVKYGGNLRRKLAPPEVLTATNERELASVEAAFEDAFDAPIDVVDRVRTDLVTRRCRRPLYRRLLERINPELVVVVVGYVRGTAIDVCRELSIPVVELQHGVISPYHAGYAYPGEGPERTFPDYLFTFGEFWGRSVELPIPEDRVYPVGYPHLEAEAAAYDSGASEGVLFVSQGTIGAELSRLAVELAELIDAEIVYKLHPGEYDGWRERYPWLVGSDVEVVADADLYALFADAGAQVGVYSTALYEGLYFDLETYLLDCPGVSQLRPLVDEGAATVVGSAPELADRLGSPSSGGVDNVERFFRPGAIDNVADALERVRERS